MNYKDIDFYSFCFPGNSAKMRMPKQTDLMLGSAIHQIYNPLYIHDDTDDNISDKNYWFGQTTGLYWLWKNSSSDYIGICTYRLFWNQDELALIDIDENTLIIPRSIDVNTAIRDSNANDKYNILSHLIHCHGEIVVPLLYGLCKIDDIPITTKMIDSLKDQTGLHPFNMFIASKRVNNKISEILFNVLFKFYNHYGYLFQTIESYTGQKRILDFLAERILHIIYKNINYFIPNIKVYEVDIINLPH